MGIRRINTLAGKLMNALRGTEIIHCVAGEMTAFDEDVFTPISIIILAAFSIWFSFFISKPEIASASGIFGVRSVTIGKSFSSWWKQFRPQRERLRL